MIVDPTPSRPQTIVFAICDSRPPRAAVAKRTVQTMIAPFPLGALLQGAEASKTPPVGTRWVLQPAQDCQRGGVLRLLGPGPCDWYFPGRSSG